MVQVAVHIIAKEVATHIQIYNVALSKCIFTEKTLIPDILMVVHGSFLWFWCSLWYYSLTPAYTPNNKADYNPAPVLNCS